MSNTSKLSENKQILLLQKWNQTKVDFADNLCIHQLFENQVYLNPNEVAVRFDTSTLTYTELNKRSNQLAHYLRSQGVGQESLVAICLERSLDLIVTILGILKAGGAYIPLDPAYPSDRLLVMLSDAKPKILITHSELIEKLSEYGDGKVVRTDMDHSAIEICSSDNPVNYSTPSSLAYVIYTSGSTGKPKGVMVEHKGWINYCQSARQTYTLGPGEKTLQFASISWDTSAEEMFPTLTSGGTLVLRTPDMVDSMNHFLKCCKTWGITIINIPTAFWHELITQMAYERLKLPSTLRIVIIGGERALAAKLSEWHKLDTANVHLFNTYGQTECTAVTTCCELNSSSLSEGEVPLGKPVHNICIYVLDEKRNRVAIGEPGELFVGGAGVGRGYLNLPELTAKQFISNPHSSSPEDRLYGTGDLVRFRMDGNLEFVGRVDQQVKIRGIRIEPGEIEATLMHHPSVQMAAVTGQPIGPTPSYLAAYVVLHPDKKVTDMEIREWLEEHLPEFMVPAIVMTLESLPLTPNGKIDRRSLPVPDFSKNAEGTQDDTKLTPVQEKLTVIWSEILGISHVGLHDNFFLVGGHSLLATRVIARITQQFNVEIPLRTLFLAPTIQELSEHIENSDIMEGTEPPLVPQPADQSPVTSFSQEGLWFSDKMYPGNSTNNIVDALHFTGPFDVKAFEYALNQVVQRHSSLRTNFINVNGQPQPVINQNPYIHQPVIEIADLTEPEQIDYARQAAVEEVLRPFDLERDQLLRTTILQFSPESHCVIFITHHIVTDGWSLSVFFEELASLYADHIENRTSFLPELSIQYSDYAAWLRQRIRGKRLSSQIEYWKRKLEHTPVLNLPSDKPRPKNRGFAGKRVPIRFSPEFTQALHDFCQKEDITVFIAVMTAFQALLSRHANQTDISVGTVIANRPRPELESLVGFFINTLALRNDFSGNPSFREMLALVKETTLSGFSNSEVAFEHVVQEVHPQRFTNRHPLFDVMLLLQNVPPVQPSFSGLKTTFLELDQKTSEFDISFDLQETANGLQGTCEFDTDLFETDSMVRFVDHFQTLLIGSVENPNLRLTDLPLLNPQEREQLLVTWNQNSQMIPMQSLPDLFEAQVKLTPDQTAAHYREESITYKQLNQRSNQLAHYLIQQGVQTESIVGVCKERSIDMLVVILGVHKAGAAYVPLDTAYPNERLNYMLTDSGAAWLITDTSNQSKFNTYNGQTLNTDTIIEQLKNMPVENTNRELTPENACYVLYTSGSTGKPKGVVGLHQAAVNRIKWMWETYPFTDGEIACQKTALSFVDSIWEIFGPLLHGVPIVIIPDEDIKDTRKFIATLATNKISRIVLVPSLLQTMLDSFQDLEKHLPNLKLWISSGETLSFNLADKFLQRFSDRKLLNLYGSSEVAADSTYCEVTKPELATSIGRPIFNTETYILDEYRQPVPIGVVGEIYIGGLGLARGYWNRPSLTADRFIPHPFGKTGARLFKTGDQGRYKSDGNIEYIGRTDFQIKIRGMRVELSEVQSAIARHPALSQAVVIATQLGGGNALAAYIVPKDIAPSIEDLRTFTLEILPEYMVPSIWITLETIPLTPNGKIDVKALPNVTEAGLSIKRDIVEARDELELRLVKLWERLLERQPVSIDDNFFEIGGHSLLVVRLITQLEKDFGKPLSLALLFHAPSIRKLADVLRDDGWQPTWSSLVPIQTKGTRPPLFCVHANGGAFFYTNFTKHLSPDQPLFGIQARGLDGKEPPFNNVEEMAAHYIKEMRSVQPTGPYIIGGFSMGGVVIYEMAQQLFRVNETPSLIIFLDAPSNDYPEMLPTHVSSKLKDFLELSTRGKIERIKTRSVERIRQTLDEILCRVYLFLDRPMPPALRIHAVRKMNRRIAADYEPKSYPGPITILRADEPIPGAKPDRTLGWGEYVTGQIHDFVVPGNHETVYQEPNVEILVHHIELCIDAWLSEKSHENQ